MKVCKTTCDICETEIDGDPKEIGLGRIGHGGSKKVFSYWYTFHLCEKCFNGDNAKATFKTMWTRMTRREETK